MKSKSLLDLMSPEDKEKAIARGQKRMEKRKARRGLDVSPEMFEIAEFGYYFGWEAVMAVRRGYTVEPHTGDRELLSMQEVQVLLEAARKVWYTKLIEQAGTGMASTAAAFSKTPRDSLEKQLQPIKDRAEIKD